MKKLHVFLTILSLYPGQLNFTKTREFLTGLMGTSGSINEFSPLQRSFYQRLICYHCKLFFPKWLHVWASSRAARPGGSWLRNICWGQT